MGRPSQVDYINAAKRYLDYHDFCLDEAVDLGEVIEQLKSYRAGLFTETDIYTLLSKGMSKAFRKNTNCIMKNDLQLQWFQGRKSTMTQLEEMIGLENAKETVKRLISIKKVMMDKNRTVEADNLIHTNMIFAGNPGTGKSKLAELYAKLLAEIGVSNGHFENVSRADIIGKYVGHTAAKIKELFERSVGGVIFVDEAAFLLGSDNFIQEAVIEFVRFMEMYPATTVIFATYKQKAEELLGVDAGFRSRITRIISFEDYSNEELWCILKYMSEGYGVKLDEGCRIPMEEYIEKIRREESFANAREVRKLLETSMEEYGLRVSSDMMEPISPEDMERAVSA